MDAGINLKLVDANEHKAMLYVFIHQHTATDEAQLQRQLTA